MQANYVQRLRLTFSKSGPARYIGHLDLARTLERALNRARIPIAYSQGFNRRPRLSFAAALPLGYTSEYELADIWLFEELDPPAAGRQMMEKMAPGIVIRSVAEVPLKAPSLQSQTLSADYSAMPLDWIAAQALRARVDSLLAEQILLRERKKGKGKAKSYDLRPLITALSVDRAEDDNPSLKMTLLLMAGQTGRPDEVLTALDLDPLAARIHRLMITLQSES